MSGGKKQTTTSNQQTSTSTQLPAWLTQAGQSIFQQAQGAIPKDLGTQYGGQMTAGTSANQQQASQMASAGAGNWQADLNAARDMTKAAAGAAPASVGAQNVNAAQMGAAQQGYATAGNTPQAQAAQQGPVATYQAAGNGQAPSVQADQVNAGQFDSAAAAKYMNPYQQQVQQNTLAEMQRQNDMDHASLNDSVQGAKAFGGSRQALLESEQAKNQSQQKQNYIDSSNAQAYSDAQQQFERDRNASLQAQTANQAANLQAGTTNASFLNDLFSRMDAANQFNAGSTNSAAANNAQFQQQANEANAGRNQQTNLANQSAANTAAGANAEHQQQANQFNATSQNQIGQQNADRNLAADTTNAGLYEQMLQRLMGGGAQMGQIGTAASNLNSADIRNLSSTGAVDQATNQAGLDSQYQEWLRSRSEPMDMYSQLMAMLNGTPRDVTTSGTSSGTQTQKTSGSFLDSLLGGVLSGASIFASNPTAFSDPRLKKDVSLIERLANGLGIYRFRYLWERPNDEIHVGVMADEVAHIVPDALGPVIGGYLTVNYGKLVGALQ